MSYDIIRQNTMYKCVIKCNESVLINSIMQCNMFYT